MQIEMFSSTTLCRFCYMGVVDYSDALLVQNKLAAARMNDEIPDTILFLQHPPVITLGRSGNEHNIIVDRNILEAEEISVLHVDRGGDVTYHGLGQLVCYLILDLKKLGIGVHQYVYHIEEAVIRTLQNFGIFAHRDPKYPGVWIKTDKICALGIHLTNGITKHGFALNVNTNLAHFGYITPCGIADRGVTSISKLLGYKIEVEQVMGIVLREITVVFGMTASSTSKEEFEYHACC